MPSLTYDVPLILPGLRKEESIIQIVNALDYLQQVSNDVFSKIDKRVAENRQRIAAIDKRANVAMAKIDKIRGSRKAIRVFSSAKYPAPEKLQQYNSLHVCDGFDRSPGKLNGTDKSYHVTTGFGKTDHSAIKDKLQFYTVQLNVPKKRADESDQGLGGLPKDVSSISSLLLFNTTENPYKKYVILDPLEGAITKTRKGLEEDTEDLAAAPVTITNREEMELLGLTNYFYSPNLGDVPELDVPVHLPDLPGIADDLAWSADLGPSIAPSMPGSNVPELPELIPEEPAPMRTPNQIDSQSSSQFVPPPPPPPDPVAEPPPPPPPPPQPMEENAAPQAPPAPAPAAEDQSTSSGGNDSGRADLMAAIRNAGGAGKAKLKNPKERKQKKRAQKEAPSSGGGDLMGDLFAKLSMRRKGISGSRGDKSSEDTGGGSAMDKISSMIPPPTSNASLSNDNDDWDP